MGQVILVEILDKSGRVEARSKHDRFPVKIGRAYSNDVIIDDEYVSPEHLAIELNQDETINAVDLDSSNGVYLNATEKVSRTVLDTDNLLRIGHTTLRVRTPEHPVLAAIKEAAGLRFTQRLVSSAWSFALILPITAAILIWTSYWETYTVIKPPALLLPPTIVLAMLMAWAGIWALASRLYAHRSYYFVHAVIVCIVFIGLLIFDILLEYYAFAFSTRESAEILTYGVFAVLAGLLLFWHLRTFLQTKSKYLALSAGLIACTLAALTWLSLHAALSRDTGRLDYNASLKPLAFKVSGSLSVDEFSAKIANLKTVADDTAND